MKKIFKNIGKFCFIIYLIILTIGIIACLIYSLIMLFIAYACAILDTISHANEDIPLLWFTALKMTFTYFSINIGGIISITSGIKYLSKSNLLDLLKAFLIIPIIIGIYIFKPSWLTIF